MGIREVRASYAFGQTAASNPAHRDRKFDEIEHDLQKEWAEDVISRHGDWESARRYARRGYERGTLNRGGA